MNYRSLGDLASAVNGSLHKIPRTVDLVVGVPRSGMLAASVIGLKLNLPITDLQSAIDNRPLTNGQTRKLASSLQHPHDARHVLLIDDSVASGSSLRQAVERIAAAPFSRVTTCAVFGANSSNYMAEICMEVVPFPRVFEWNVMHHPLLREACLDIDGILCVDPLAEENDDGECYTRFLLEAKPYVIPSVPVGHLVTSRLERYRPATEEWLRRHRVVYSHLHMLDLPSAEERRRLGAHASFKAAVYSSLPDTRLFIESEPEQARRICHISAKPVLCLPSNELIAPGAGVRAVARRAESLVFRVRRRLRRIASF